MFDETKDPLDDLEILDKATKVAMDTSLMMLHEQERRKLWMDIFIDSLRSGARSTAAEAANDAVDAFDKKFGGHQ
jgi:hypothetical protein